jgi:predicted XRE-type DNA-binding protein
MNFPDEKKFKKMRDKPQKVDGFLMLDEEASELDRFRFKICQELLKYSHKNEFKDAEMAELLGLTKVDMSRIFNHRIDKFSTDKLIQLYAKIKPKGVVAHDPLI